MAQAYVVSNLLSGLAASAFTVASGPSDSTRAYLNDGKTNKLFTCTAAGSGNTFSIDLGSAQSVMGLALLNHNLSTFGGTVTAMVQGADDSGFSVNLVTAKALTTLDFTQPKHKDHVFQFSAHTKRYWRIVLTWTGTQTMTVGELFLFAASTQLSRKDVWGASGDGERFNIKTVTSEYLETRGYLLAGPQRQRRLVYQDLTLSEQAELRTWWRAVNGPLTPFLWIESYEAVDTAAAASEQEVIYGKLGLSEFAVSYPDFSRYAPPPLIITALGREKGA